MDWLLDDQELLPEQLVLFVRNKSAAEGKVSGESARAHSCYSVTACRNSGTRRLYHFWLHPFSLYNLRRLDTGCCVIDYFIYFLVVQNPFARAFSEMRAGVVLEELQPGPLPFQKLAAHKSLRA